MRGANRNAALLVCGRLVVLAGLSACGEPQPGFHRLADLWIGQNGRENTVPAQATIKNITRTAIPIAVGGEVRIRVEIPADAELRAQLAVVSRPETEESREFTLEASVCDPRVTGVAGAAPRIRIGEGSASIGSWTPVRFDLGDFAGAGATLCFTARRGDGGEPPAANESVLWLANATLATRGLERWPSKQPNLLVITLDTTRGDHLSGAGYPRPTSPNLDRLARHGEQFLDAVANSPWTLPSHGSLFTGLHPREHGARFDPDGEHDWLWKFFGLAPELFTLAEQLWTLGYRTGAVVAGPMVSAEFGFAQGFDYYDEPPYSRAERSGQSGSLPQRDAEEVTDRALAWLAGDDRPFLLFLNYFDPHRPYEPPDDLAGRWAQPGTRPMAPDEYTRIWGEVIGGHRDLRDSERRAMIDNYDAEILAMDRSIGRLLDGLEQRDLYESTMIVVVSDHGESFGEHRLLDHGHSLYQHQLRTALIIKYPQHASGDRRARRYEHRVDLLDVHATMLREMGLLSGTKRRGIHPVAETRFGSYGVHKRRPYHFAELRENTWFTAAYGTRFARNLDAVFHGDWKLIRDDKGNRWLFDLAEDPLEQKNLAAATPAVADGLDRALDSWARSHERVKSDDVPLDLSPDLIERLQELGYLGTLEDE